jgi:nucleoid DNA-binding protein
MIVQKETRILIKELAKKYNLSFEDTRDIIWSQFKYVKEEIAKGNKDGNVITFKNIMLRYLGTFYTKEGRLKRIVEAKRLKNERLNKGV